MKQLKTFESKHRILYISKKEHVTSYYFYVYSTHSEVGLGSFRMFLFGESM